MTRSHRRVLAAVSMDGSGGGVGAVSRLLWRSLQDRWGDRADLVTAMRRSGPFTLPGKIWFGARTLGRQVTGQADWILFGHLGLARVQALLPRRLRCRYGIFIHGVEAWGDLSPADLELLRHAALRVANSDYTAQRVMARHPSIGHVSVCPLALSPDEPVVPARPERRRGRTNPVVLMVGRMSASEAYKGHAETIAAWPQVVRACPDARLMLVGDGDDLPRLRALAAQSGVRETITFTGFLARKTLQDLYDDSVVFVMPSRGEGFGIVYLEAMAHGLPCIGSRHDAAGDVIVDGVTGHLVSQDEPRDIARHIIGLLKEPARAREMGDVGRRRVRDVFGFDRFAARMVDLVERTLESPAAASLERRPAPASWLGRRP